MKKLIIIAIIVLFVILCIKSANAAYPQYRTTKNGVTYTCDQVKWLDSGIYCSTFINKKLKSLGISTLEEWTGLYDATGKRVYEGDTIYYPPTGEFLLVKKVNDSIFGTGWCLMYTEDSCYPLANDYGRILLQTGFIVR